uniref:(northern house mosquito) hypothetical protein n=1 Tax=Culex pipiens TaxID=7175 RepID=A0A8D8F2H7_CULPI
MMALNSQNRSELSPSKKIFNVSARISRFPTIFRLATKTKNRCALFHTKFYNLKVTCLEYVTAELFRARVCESSWPSDLRQCRLDILDSPSSRESVVRASIIAKP